LHVREIGAQNLSGYFRVLREKLQKVGTHHTAIFPHLNLLSIFDDVRRSPAFRRLRRIGCALGVFGCFARRRVILLSARGYSLKAVHLKKSVFSPEQRRFA
jgi:hypothetical protein